MNTRGGCLKNNLNRVVDLASYRICDVLENVLVSIGLVISSRRAHFMCFHSVCVCVLRHSGILINQSVSENSSRTVFASGRLAAKCHSKISSLTDRFK